MQSNLLPLDPSPIGTADRMMPDNLDEVLEYGTDADCRRALGSIADQLGLDTVAELYVRLEDLDSDNCELEGQVIEAYTARDKEIAAHQKTSAIADKLADALVDLQAHMKGALIPQKIIDACEKAIDNWEDNQPC